MHRTRAQLFNPKGKIQLCWDKNRQRWFVHVSTPSHAFAYGLEICLWINRLNHK